MWLGGIEVRALDFRLEIASSIPAAALSSATLDKLFTQIAQCLWSYDLMVLYKSVFKKINKKGWVDICTAVIFVMISLINKKFRPAPTAVGVQRYIKYSKLKVNISTQINSEKTKWLPKIEMCKARLHECHLQLSDTRSFRVKSYVIFSIIFVHVIRMKWDEMTFSIK